MPLPPLSHHIPAAPKKLVCCITGDKPRYREPMSGQPYKDKAAFKILHKWCACPLTPYKGFIPSAGSGTYYFPRLFQDSC